MKLVFAIVHSEDSHRVMDALNKDGFQVTKLCSTGGFLRAGNTTLLAGVEPEKLEQVMEILKKHSRSRSQVVGSTMPGNGIGSMMMAYPVEVTVGGATVFVLDVERFEKY